MTSSEEAVRRSPHLTPLFLKPLDSMKSIAYGTPVTSEEDLIARVNGKKSYKTTELIGSCV